MTATVTPTMLAAMPDEEVLAVIAQHREIAGDPNALDPRLWPLDAGYTDADVLAALRELPAADYDDTRVMLQHAHNYALDNASLRLYRERVAHVRAREANARLSAAAPDLLAACNQALALLETNHTAWEIAPQGPVFNALRAAIAKATGA